jgi:hypothetical protein
MQERPNKLVLLSAIARFLVEDARPALSDPRLAFRALIAANLASIVASELSSDAEATRSELARLRALFPDAPPAGESLDGERGERDERDQVLALTERLARRLREESPGEDELARIAAALRESLREKLAVDNPRFDTSPEIE